MPTSTLTFTYKDYASQRTSCSWNVTPLTAANLDAQVILHNSLSSAILAVQKENCLQGKAASLETFITRAKATDKAAKREQRWLVALEDMTLHTISHHEIPIADPSKVATDSEFVDLGDNGVWEALKTAIEAVVLSPAGNAVSVLSIQSVSKRL